MPLDLDDEEKDKDIDEEIKELMTGQEIGPREEVPVEEDVTEGLDKEEGEEEVAVEDEGS
jgi:hypothetical protein